jgi:hypothetical protein
MNAKTPSFRLAIFPLLLAAVTWSFHIASFPSHSGDSAQFQFVAETLSIPHPPGSPVYVWATWAFNRLLPGASPALATNLFSLFCGLGLLFMLGRVARRWGISSNAIALAGLMLIGSPLFARLATVSEVYVPSLFALTVAMDRIAAWADTGRTSSAIAAGIAAGLGLGIYSGAVAMLPPLAIQIALARPGTNRARGIWLAAIMCGFVTAAAYASQIPRLLDPSTTFRWSQAYDLDSTLRFLTAESFRGHFSLSPESASLGRRMAIYVEKLMKETVWLPSLLLLMLTIARGFSGFRRTDLVPAILLVANLLFVVTYDVWDVWDFLLPGVVGISFLVARTIDVSILRLRQQAWSRWMPLAATLMIVVTSLTHAAFTFDNVRQRTRDRTGHENAIAILDMAAPNGVIICAGWDDATFLWYHLLGPESRWPGVDVALDRPAIEISRYLAGSKDMLIWQTGEVVETGRPVILMGESRVREFEALGGQTEQLMYNVYRAASP